HLFRLRQARHEFAIRLQERVDERTRIAQELHDTLLQGLLSASLQLELANSDLEEGHPAKEQATGVFHMLRQLIDEGRNTLRGLRTPRRTGPDVLAEQFAKLPRELTTSGGKLSLIVEGNARDIPPPVLEEVYRIGREALVNALRHAGASVVEMVLEYAPQH